ncbi:MAG: PEP-CTERM system TPR-repeat protein PrsT [Proteobacteria bacterium]|nr:MAG: PEP-CTERM system TPR-repeat protein PrsT [Pseudomonadota bacterium]
MIEFRSLVLVLLVIALAAGVGCVQQSDPASLIAKANAYRQKGDFRAATIELRNVLQQNPGHAEARFLLGTTYLEMAEPAFAAIEFQKAQDLGYDPNKVLPCIVKSLFLQERFREALNAIDPSKVANLPDSPEILNARAWAQVGMRQLPAAKESLNLAMTLQPDFPDGMLTQARIALAEGDAAAAGALISRALQLEPKNMEGWSLRGTLQRQSGQVELARASYRKAIEINPHSVAARLDLASLEIETGRSDDAARELEVARGIAPRNVTAVYLQALLELRGGNSKAALHSVNRALEIAPQHVPSTLLGGLAELALGHPDQAEVFLRAAVDLTPENISARRLLAASQIQSRRFAQAIATVERGLDRGVGASDPALLALAGEAYLRSKQYGKATQYFERAVALDSRSASTRISLGISRIATGNTDRAIAELEAAAKLDPGGIRADILLAMLNVRDKQFDQALQTIAKIEVAHPDDALVHSLKGSAYLGKGNTDQARAQFERALKVDPAYFPAAASLATLDLKAGNATAARHRYESVLEKDKNQALAMLALADLAARTPGAESEALTWIHRAKAAAPDSNEPVRAEIDHLRRSGQLEEAIAVAVEQRNLHPDDPDTLLVLAKLLVAAKRTPEAVIILGYRVVLLPNSAEAAFELASAQVLVGDLRAADDTLQKTLRLKPRYPEAMALSVAVDLTQHRSDRAMSTARAAQKEMPKAALGYELEGDVLAATKKHAQAVASYEKAYALHRSGLLAIKIHAACAEAGKPDKCDAQLKQWLSGNPADTKTRRYYADSAAQRGKYALAVQQYGLVLDRDPNNAIVLNNMAWSMNELKDPSATGFAERAYALKPGDGAVADTLGKILVESGDLNRGLEILQKGVAAAPSHRELRFHFAQALAKSGDKAKAIEELTVLLDSGAKFPQEAEAVAMLKQLRQ